MVYSASIEIRQPDENPKIFEIKAGVYTIGTDEDCRSHLRHPDVDPRHAVLTVHEDGCWIEDLDAHSGTFLGDTQVKGRCRCEKDKPIRVGPFSLVLTIPDPPDPPPAEPDVRPSAPDSPSADTAARAATARTRSIKAQIHRELVDRLDLKRLTTARIDQEELRRRARQTIVEIVGEVSGRLPPGIDRPTLVKEVYDEAIGLGPLEDLLEDETVTEIMVNGHEMVYVERHGKLELTNQEFMDDNSVLAVIERIVSPLGRRIDESQPFVDARLPDGSRVNAIIHPLSLIGPCLTIRKFAKTPFTLEDLYGFGTLTPDIAEFANVCVQLRKNIIVSGGTGCGKTTLLNVLSDFLPRTERIVTIEDAAELRLRQQHVIRLEARPPNIEGKGAVTIRDLVRNSLRMRPDRIVVGECRGGEALDMLQAMNTGHDGSLTTIHANSPRDVISRLETMVLMAGMDLPVRAIREQISSAIDIIVHEARFSDGSRRVSQVSEIVGQEGDQITMQEIFEFNQTGLDDEGRVLGKFRPTGSVPTFLEELQSRGLHLDHAMFDPLKARE